MSYRKSTKPAADKKAYSNTAKKTKLINIKPKPARGGIRF